MFSIAGQTAAKASPLRQNVPMNVSSDPAICPKCRTGMVHVAVTLHPIVPGMQRNTFVCYGCNQTRTYMLPVAPAEAVAK
jgi:hypothetical protein